MWTVDLKLTRIVDLCSSITRRLEVPKLTRGFHVNKEKVASGDFHPNISNPEVSKTHGVHPSLIVILYSIRSPCQIQEIILWEVFLLSIQSSQDPKLAPSLSMV